jgi:hypothetical protein
MAELVGAGKIWLADNPSDRQRQMISAVNMQVIRDTLSVKQITVGATAR